MRDVLGTVARAILGLWSAATRLWAALVGLAGSGRDGGAKAASRLPPLRVIFAGILAVTGAVLVEALLYLARGPVYAVLLTIAFLVGAAIIPLWAYGLLDSIPVASPALGKLLLTVAMMSIGMGVLTQQANNSYRITAADEDTYEPSGYWQRFALGWLGITYERTEEAFGDAVIEKDLDALEQTDPEGDSLPGSRASIDIERGGKKSYVRTDVDEDAILVAIGQKLSELRDSAGIGIPNRVQLEALKNYGGDSSKHDATTMAAATFAFTALGAMLGYVIFFMGGA